MGASSVTGTGLGEAGITRGPGNNRNNFYSVVDPHVVWHGVATITNNIGVVMLPSNIRLPPTQLAVFVSGKSTFVYYKIVEDGIMTGFVVFSAGMNDVDYIVVDANNSCFCEQYTGML
jgi:hypothetical protein